MIPLLLLMAAAPVVLDCELESRERLYLRLAKAEQAAAAKKTLMAEFYSKKITCRAMRPEEKQELRAGYRWFDFTADGRLQDLDPAFEMPLAKISPTPGWQVLQLESQCAMRLYTGQVSAMRPGLMYLRAPDSWVADGGITAAGQQAMTRDCGGPDWGPPNGVGSRWRLKSFTSRVVEGELPDTRRTRWYEVTLDGGIEERKRGFSPIPPPRHDTMDSARRGPLISDSKVLLDWLGTRTGLVMLPVTLKGRAATVGTLETQIDDQFLELSLEQYVKRNCPKEPTCHLWLVGEWKNGTLVLASVTSRVDEQSPEMAPYAWFEPP